MMRAGVNLDSRILRKPGLATANLDGETVLLDVASGNYYSYDPIGSRIWEMLAQPLTVNQLCGQLIQHYEVEAERCRHDVLAFVGDLSDRGLLSFEGHAGDSPAS